MLIIDNFKGEYRFLSNFHFVNVEMDGEIYPTTEHAYQAAKTLSEAERRAIREVKKPGDARKLGQLVKMRDDWEEIKFDVMLDLTRKKFQDTELARRLLATGDAELVEGNTWGDSCWGVCNGVGTNWLGKILMQVRNEIRSK